LRRQRAEKQTGFNQLDTGHIPVYAYCSEELKKITSSEAALSRPFNVVNLTSPNKINLHIRTYVDFYGGYAEHGRNVLFRLDDTGKYNLRLTPIKTPIDIDPIVWNRCNWYTKNPNFKKDESILLTIAGPGWMQKKYLSEHRVNIGWTMVESMEPHSDIVLWLENCDELWCPTDLDWARFAVAGIPETSLFRMHLGYDEKMYNQNIKPLDISNVRNRFVFGVLGSWNKRKNVKAIVQAFAQAFGPDDNVSLLLCCKYGTRPYGEEKENDERWTIVHEFNQYLEEIKKSPDEYPHMCLIDVPLHESVMPHLLARFDCLVGFSMGESTWLPGLQAMGMGIPIIQLNADLTNGFLEYLHDVGFLCMEKEYIYADEELYKGTSEYYEGQKFAEGNVDELAGKMEEVYEDYDNKEMRDKIELGLKKAKDWTWDKAIEEVDIRLGIF